MRAAVWFVATVCSLAACSTPTPLGTGGPEPGKDSVDVPRDRTVLTPAQFGLHQFNTAFDAIEALRSNWLKTRGTDSFQSPSQVRVYLDNISLGDTATLRTIPLTNIVYIRYFDGIQATARWGLDHGVGVIYVSTRPATSDPDD
ncbi:MAG: hypothetical protein ACREPM_07050 [Gemmatimonadaceae bacterium]